MFVITETEVLAYQHQIANLELQIKGMQVTLERLIQEREQRDRRIAELEAENADLRAKRITVRLPQVIDGEEDTMKCIGRLTAERDALKADAERYRWLREIAVTENDAAIERLAAINAKPKSNDEFDATIDAAKGE